MAKAYKLTESQIPERRSQSLYADIVADFVAQDVESMQVNIEGMKPATLCAGLRRALKGNEGVKLPQRGQETCLVKAFEPGAVRVLFGNRLYRLTIQGGQVTAVGDKRVTESRGQKLHSRAGFVGRRLAERRKLFRRMRTFSSSSNVPLTFA